MFAGSRSFEESDEDPRPRRRTSRNSKPRIHVDDSKQKRERERRHKKEDTPSRCNMAAFRAIISFLERHANSSEPFNGALESSNEGLVEIWSREILSGFVFVFCFFVLNAARLCSRFWRRIKSESSCPCCGELAEALHSQSSRSIDSIAIDSAFPHRAK
jgi:hypothetical protein